MFLQRTLLLILLSIATSHALSEDGTPSSVFDEAGPVLKISPIALHLAKYLPVADTSGELSSIAFQGDVDYEYLSSGWNPMETDDSGAGASWTKTRNAVVDFQLVARRNLTVRLKVAPPPKSESLPRQTLQVRWNGTEIDTFLLEWGVQEIQFQVPLSLQRVGPNRMELMPLYWLKPDAAGLESRGENVGVQVHSIEFVSDGETRNDVATPATVVGESIIHHPGSVISYYFVLPEDAVLRGTGQLQIPSAGLPDGLAGALSVRMLDAQGQRKILFSKNLSELARDGKVSIEQELTELSGQMVALSLSFASTFEGSNADTFSSKDLYFEWSDLRIEGAESLIVDDPLRRIRRKYNVFIILFDSLRPDFTEPYGSLEVKTPAMNRFAGEGVTFINTWANSSWTRPSIASMFTSLYPAGHGVFRGNDAIPADLPILPEILQQMGYATLEVTTSPQTYPKYGFGRGFDLVHRITSVWIDLKKYPKAEQRADYTWDRYIAPFLDENGDKPFFIFLHELDPHLPYDPPPPYDALYGEEYRGNISDEDFLWRSLVEKGLLHLEEADIRRLRGLYKGKITFVDDYFARLMRRFSSRESSKDTLVVLVSDHGEEFLEHGRITHGKSLYEEVLRVPLILKLEGVIPAGRRPAVFSQLIDVPPTILDLVGGERPSSMRGQSLLPFLLAPDEYAPSRALFAHQGLERIPLVEDSVVFGKWKLIRRSPVTDTSMHQFVLYDLEQDHEELIDRWPGELLVGKTLRQMLAWRSSLDERVGETPSSVQDLDDQEIEEQLRALGYLD